jgi:exodeoxyribonuclease V gamma subunit
LRLTDLVSLYREGMMQPVHFFPKSARALIDSGSFREARQVWRSTRHQPWGEDRDPAWRLALRGNPEPLDSSFRALAVRVFGPLLDHLER